MQTTLSIADIWVSPDRQRKDLGDVTDLATSIAQVGLINPITVTKDGMLIAGERRLTACKSIGLIKIPVRYLEDLTPRQIKLIEYDENTKRKDIDWKEAIIAVKNYSVLYREEVPDAADKDVAQELGMSRQNFSRYLGIAEYLETNHPKICAAPNLSTARGIWERAEARKTAYNEDELTKALSPAEVKTEPNTVVDSKPPDCPIFKEDFLTYTATRTYNFIHCDFPYGINIDKADQGAAPELGGYNDTFEVYWDLLKRLSTATFVADSAHLMFWFSMDYYHDTLLFLTEAGWVVNTFPLIWHKSDNTGILPDAKRGPRRIYETALFAHRGDRPVVQSVGNCFAAPTTKKIHMSEKPIAVLSHFFRMFVDEYTVMLDPTCGSGNAVIAAHKAKARSVTGLEINPEFHQLATENWYEQTS